MTSNQVATDLRERQYRLGEAPRETIDALSDDQIIDSYITCSGCGHHQVPAHHLSRVIEIAHDTDQFFQIADLYDEAVGGGHAQHR